MLYFRVEIVILYDHHNSMIASVPITDSIARGGELLACAVAQASVPCFILSHTPLLRIPLLVVSPAQQTVRWPNPLTGHLGYFSKPC